MKNLQVYLRSFISVLVITAVTINSHATRYEPDFEYPQTVITKADSTLKISMKEGDKTGIIKSLLQITKAQSLISPESFINTIKLTDSIASIEKDVAAKAILYSIEAEQYKNYYNNNLYIISRRKNIDTTVSQDITEWDKTAFETKIYDLITESLASPDILKKTPIGNFKNILSFSNEQELTLIPSVYDFIAYRSINILKESRIKPLLRINGIKTSFTDEIKKLYRDLIIANKNNIPALIKAESEYINYCAFNNYYDYSGRNNTQSNLLKQYISLYDKYKDNPYSGEILLNMYPLISDNEPYLTFQQYYTDLHNFIKKYPDYFRINAIKEKVNDMESKTVNLTYNRTFSRNDSVKVTGISRNLTDYTVSLYRLPDNFDRNKNKIPLGRLKLIEQKNIHLDKKAIPYNDSVTITFKPLNYGYYTVLSDYNVDSVNVLKDKYSSQNINVINVSDIYLLYASNNLSNKGQVIAVNGQTGVPMEGVTIKDTSSKPKTINPDKTNKEGILNITNNNINRIKGTKSGDIFSNELYIYSYNGKRTSENGADILTDLGIYKPGDSVKFTAICYKYMMSDKKVNPNDRYNIKITKPDGETLKDIDLLSDSYGRISSAFEIPKDGLNGIYRISLYHSKKFITSSGINVSDYKAPAFFISLNDSIDKAIKGAPVIITGYISGFSGLPLANTVLTFKLERIEWFNFMTGGAEEIYSSVTKSYNSGNFDISLPSDLFSKNDRQYSYKLTVTATSPDGETIEKTKEFSINPNIQLELPDKFNLEASSKTRLPIKVISSELPESPIVCNFILTSQKDGKSYNGSFKYDDPEIDLSEIPSGQYSINVSVANDTIIPKVMSNTVIYRKTDSKSPVNNPLWVAVNDVACDKNSSANILLATPDSKTYIYYTVQTESALVESGWLKNTSGMKEIKFNMPEKFKSGEIQLYTTKGFETITETIAVRPYQTDRYDIIPVLFRDKTVPNSKEELQLKFTKNGEPCSGASIVDIYDSALNSIYSNQWNNNKYFQTYFYFNESMRYDYYYKYNNYLTWTNPFKKEIPDFNIPELIAYGSSNRNSVRLFASAVQRDNGNIYSADVAAFGAMSRSAKTEDAVEEKMAVADEALSKTDSGVKEITYREKEVRCAMWNPYIVTDKDGNFKISFNVPNENTTWLFQALTYSKELDYAIFTKEILVNKPIMVQPNLPSFLRQGDMVTLKSSVLNATDTIQDCRAKVELYNIDTNKIIKEHSYDLSILPKGTGVVDFSFNVPDTLSYIGYRISAQTDQFGDGEQNIISILPSISPVIDTYPFYITAGKDSYSVNLPKVPTNSKTTLEYSNNPAWYCISALPSLDFEDKTTSTGIMDNIFKTIMGSGILKEYPLIGSALKDWTQNNSSDSVLVSVLEKNQSLKITDIINSPWVSDAAKQTLRMKSLANYTDSAYVTTNINKNISLLKNMQLEDGGWCWTKESGSSLYPTGKVLLQIGRLKNLGFLQPDNSTSRMIEKAVKYFDKKTTENWGRTKTFDINDYLDYLYIRSYFDEIPLSAAAGELKRQAMENLRKNAIKFSGDNKAKAIILLYKYDDKKLAARVLESLRQFAVYSPDKGMYWNNSRGPEDIASASLKLEAFNTLNPGSKDTEAICQWLLLNKQANDWGSGSQAIDAIYAIISASGKWFVKTDNNISVSVNNKEIPLSPKDKYIGYINTAIDLSDVSGNSISISRPATSPAWGAIYCQYNSPMKNITGASTPALSIEKSLLLDNLSQNGTKSGKELYKTGDKIRIQFVIKNDRDMEYVVLKDERGACFQPLEVLSGNTYQDGISFYMDIKNSETNFFIPYLPKGTHILFYDVFLNSAGEYNVGIATIQSQYAPEYTAHSKGFNLNVE